MVSTPDVLGWIGSERVDFSGSPDDAGSMTETELAAWDSGYRACLESLEWFLRRESGK